ncbi:MAG: hypothetical protein K1X82_10240 [Bacteroidia bacterium]|nr:hypothetical protein [Bacteroidia bacterium]
MKQTLKATFFLTAFATCISAFAQDVKVTSNIPATVEAGKEFTVELTVTKGDVSGFAKLQQELPAGMTASPDNPNGSTFSFKEQKVKFLWMALPGDKTFKVSYKVKVDASVSGDQILEGSFSYIQNNETQNAALPKDIIKVTASGAVATTTIKSADPVTPNVSVETSSQGGNVEVSASTSQNSSSEGSGSKEAEVAAQRKADEAKAKQEKEAEDRRKAEAAAQVAASQPKAEPKATTSAPKASARVNGLVYRVQVAATKRKVDGAEFKTQFNLTDNVAWEEHEGWNKYVIGEFQNYKAAKAYSNSVRDNNGVPGPFVTAYQDGVRISVQEALDKQGR